MTSTRNRWVWVAFGVAAVAGGGAATLMQPQPLAAAPEGPVGVEHRLSDVERQLAELEGQLARLQELERKVGQLQELLAGLERGGDGEFVFLDPVEVNHSSSGLALHVVGDTVIESGRGLPETKSTLTVVGRTLFSNGNQLGLPSVNVAGYLAGDIVESGLLLCDEVHAEETVSGRVLECEILTCSDTGLFSNNLVVGEKGTLIVQGELNARGADVRLPPHEH